MSNNIAVSITADVADLQVKRAIMSAELKAATRDLNAFAKEAASSGNTEALREGMLASATAAEKARVGIAQIKAELKDLGAAAVPATEAIEHGFETASFSIREMGVQVRESFAAIGEMREAMMAFGEMMIAAFAIERIAEFSRSMGEAAEKVLHLSQRMGTSVADVQRLNAMAIATGGDIDQLAMGVARLDKAFAAASNGSKQQEAAFEKIGVSTKTAYTQMELLNATMAGLSAMADGPAKAAVAMELLGKSGAQLIPMLNMSKQEFEELNAKINEFGLVDEHAIEVGGQLAESWNTNKLAMQGLSNIMADAFAPAMTVVVDGVNRLIAAMIESYKAGGTMATVLDVVSGAVRAVISVVVALGAGVDFVFRTIDGAAWALAGAVEAAFDVIAGAIEALMAAFEAMHRVILDAFHLDWGAIVADFKAGMNAIGNAALEGGRNAAKDFQQGFKLGGAQWAAADQDWAAADAFVKRMNSGAGLNLKPHAVAREGTTADNPIVPKKGKSDKPNIVEEWRSQLQDELLEEKNWGVDSAAFELAFWQQKQALTKAGTKEWLAVHKEVQKAQLASFKEEQQEELSAIRATLEIKTDLAHTEASLSKIGIEEKIRAINEEESLGQISAVKAAQLRAALNAQLYQLDADLERKTYQAKLESLRAELALEHLKPAEKAAINKQIEVLEQQHMDRMRLIDAQNEAKEAQDAQKVINLRVANEKRAIESVSSSWAQALGKMVTLQASFGATVKALWQGLQQAIGNALATILEQWLVKHISTLLLGTAASKASGLAEIGTAAAVAGANGVASWALAPWPIDAGAPGFGATMAASALGFSSLLSAEGGDVDVRGGLYQLHPREMVLPAWAAQPLRAMLGGAANSNAPFAANDARGGDTHNHYNIQALDGHSVKRILMDNARHVAAAGDAGVRAGYKPKNGNR